MDEQPLSTPASAVTTSAAQQPETLAELAQTPLQAAKTGVKSGPSTKRPTPQSLVNQAGAQMEVLRQAETIKQLQKQVTVLEGQSLEAGKAFVATVTTLITSAFALVAALAWNEAIQTLFKYFFPAQSGDNVPAILSEFGYALFITIIVVVVIFYLTRLSKRLGGTSLIGEAPKAEGAKKD